MNNRVVFLPVNLPTKAVPLKPNSVRNNPSFDGMTKPSCLKTFMDNNSQLTRQANRTLLNQQYNPENQVPRLLQVKQTSGSHLSKDVFNKLTSINKNSSRILKQGSEERSSEQSSKNLSKAPIRVQPSHVSKERLPACLRQIQARPVQNIQQMIALGIMPRNFVTKQINGKQLNNLENRKPRLSNLPSQLQNPVPALQPQKTVVTTTDQRESIFMEPRGLSKEMRPLPLAKKAARLKTEQATTFITDNLTLPTTSTYCEKSKEEGSPRSRFKPVVQRQNITSNAEIGLANLQAERPALKCEESLVNVLARTRQPSKENSRHQGAISVAHAPKLGHPTQQALHKLSETLSDLEAHVDSEHLPQPSVADGDFSAVSGSLEDPKAFGPNKPFRDFEHETFENQFDSATLQYLISQESDYSPNPHYLDHRQKHLKWQMRAILVDWMQEVCSDYLFKRETFYFAINFVDRYLSIQPDVEKSALQLVGLTALFLSAKMEEVYTPKVENMVAAANNTYPAQQILALEHSLYFALNFKITPPTLNLWANWYMTQWDNFVDEPGIAKVHPLLKSQRSPVKFRLPSEQSYSLYREFMQLIDTAILDVKTLQYKQRALIAAFLYVLLGKEYKQFSLAKIVEELPYSSHYLLDQSFAFNDLFSLFMKQCFGISLLDLLPTIQYASTYFSLPITINLPVAAKIDKENVLQVN